MYVQKGMWLTYPRSMALSVSRARETFRGHKNAFVLLKSDGKNEYTLPWMQS